MTTHSSILAWEIPWTEEPGTLQSMGSQKSRTWLSNKTPTIFCGQWLGRVHQTRFWCIPQTTVLIEEALLIHKTKYNIYNINGLILNTNVSFSICFGRILEFWRVSLHVLPIYFTTSYKSKASDREIPELYIYWTKEKSGHLLSWLASFHPQPLIIAPQLLCS